MAKRGQADVTGAEIAGVAVSRETADRLAHFQSELRRWQARINLVAPSTLDDLATRHVADSLQVMALRPGLRRVIDLGSGGGFPGLVLAIALAGLPGGHVDLVESNHKKAGFLRAMLRECGGTGTVHAARIEDVMPGLPRPDLITARALAPLDQLLRMTLPKTAAGTPLLFHKGRDYNAEVEKAHGGFSFDLVVHPSRIDGDSVLLDITNVRSR